MKSTLKIVSLVEATTINAVAKNVLEFSRSARELKHCTPDFPVAEDVIVTFERQHSNDQSAKGFVHAARELGLRVEIIPERRRFDLTVIPALRKIVDQTEPDLIVTHSVKSHFLLWRSRLWHHVPWIAFHHGYTTTDRKMRVYNRLDRWSLPKADCLVTVCGAFARELAAITSVPVEQIIVQHNSIRQQVAPSADVVQDLRARLKIDDSERIALSVGRLSREKGHIDLLSAFKLLRDKYPELKVKLVVVGEGPERAKLERAESAHRMQTDVIFTGHQSDVRSFYALADVFVLPSHSEGSPNVLLEAMAASVPIVATTVGGVPEIVKNNESALLVPPKDPGQLAQAIARLLSDADLARQLTSTASALVTNKLSPEEYVRDLVRTYDNVITRSRRSQD